jgi:hypothetical protein
VSLETNFGHITWRSLDNHSFFVINPAKRTIKNEEEHTKIAGDFTPILEGREV